MEAAICIRGVHKTYDGGVAAVRALDGVDFEVFPGESVMLMGPSGSGKTTLLSIMGCILRPTSGSVKIRGREVSRLHERELPRVRLRHVGFIFQGFNLFRALTAKENVALPLELNGVNPGEARIRAARLLDAVGLAARAQARPGELSGGEKQRVAIARALIGEPDIVLADEPTAALDSASGRGVLGVLRNLSRAQGRAVVIVSHDNRATAFVDRVVYIEDGRIGEPGVA
jgi:putative ABC transport system ATP-binding protein